jgi:hypothetical protein
MAAFSNLAFADNEVIGNAGAESFSPKGLQL